MDNQIDNPFDLTKASDYSDRQVMDFWVDMATGQNSLVNFLKPKSKVPMFLLGGKGSGKTHLMRYCSSTVQALRYNGLRQAVETEKYIGTYTNADGLNVHRFKGKGQSDEVWETVFAYSFELWLTGTLLDSFRPSLVDQELGDPQWQSSFVSQVGQLFNSGLSPHTFDYDSLSREIAERRKTVDSVVNNSAITRRIDGFNIDFNPGALIFGVPKIISSICSFSSDALFIFLIDEIENFTSQQQKFLNTLVRYRRDNVSFRIGARLYGIKTFETLGSGEPIKRDAEFEAVYLDAMLRERNAQYEGLAANLILKRLEAAKLLSPAVAGSLSSQFQELEPENFYQAAALEITRVRDSTGKERPHFQRFRKFAERIIGDKEIVSSIISMLAVPSNPLLEKTNILVFYKRLSKRADLFAVAACVQKDLHLLLTEGAGSAQEYHETYSHFSSDLLAQLARDYGKKPVYAGFKSLVRISQGVPRNLLSLLKHIYRRSLFLGESPFEKGPISIEAQVQGVSDSAAWFWEDAQPDAHGTLVRNAVENLATLLRTIRYSDNPAECDLCTFKVNLSELTSDSLSILKMAENWSFLLRVSGNSSSKNDDRVLTQFQINPMLAARWGVSESRRGVLELKSAQAETLLCASEGQVVQDVIIERTEGMILPKLLEQKFGGMNSDKQSGLFDG